MAYNDQLEEKIDAAVKRWQNVEKKKMFGGVGYLISDQGQHGLRHLEGLPDRANGPGNGRAEPEAQEHQALRHHRQAYGRVGHGGRSGVEGQGRTGEMAQGWKRLHSVIA